MSDLRIAQAHTLDAGTVGRILTENNDLMPWLPRIHTGAEEIMYAEQMIDAGWVNVARIEHKVAGFLARWDNEVVALYVLPALHRQGIGSALLDAAKEECSHLGLWSYEANTGAARFYKAQGFRQVARTDGASNDVGLADIRFEWSQKGGA